MNRSLGVWLRDLPQTSPLRESSFRLFYLGSVATALGYTMQATVASWLMATLTPSTLTVALVQTASTAPTLLFGLIAGSLADIIERRKVVLIAQLEQHAAGMRVAIAASVRREPVCGRTPAFLSGGGILAPLRYGGAIRRPPAMCRARGSHEPCRPIRKMMPT